MDRIVCHFSFLLKLLKSKRKKYVALISNLTAEETQALVNCISIVGQSFKELYRATKTKSCDRIKRLLLKHEKVLKKVIFQVLLGITESCSRAICEQDGGNASDVPGESGTDSTLQSDT